MADTNTFSLLVIGASAGGLNAINTVLAGLDPEFPLPIGGGESILVSMQPVQFTSPWTYYEDRRETVDESVEVELIEEVEGGDDEE